MKKLFLTLSICLGLAAAAWATPALPGPDSQVTVSARIHYPVNVSESIVSFSENARAMQVLSTLEKENFNVSSILIKGWASPESSVSYNAALSQRRAEDVKKIIAGKYSFPEEIYDVQGMGESWEEVIDFIKNTSNSTVAGSRQQLLDIVSKYSNLDSREAAMKSVNGGLPYRVLLNEAYPSARYADCEVVFTYTSIDEDDAALLFPAAPVEPAQPEPAPVVEPEPEPAPVVAAPVEEEEEEEEADWKKWFIAAQAGPMVSFNENTWTYKDLGPDYGMNQWDLVTPYVALSVGHYFTPRIGARISAAYAMNKSALNHNETAAYGFYPYSFKSVSAFADVLLNLTKRDDVDRHWFWTLYGGLGYAHGFDFDGVNHPWQTESKYWKVPSNAFGMRGGLNLEYVLDCGLGFMLDGGLEAFTDGFNGMNPIKSPKPTGDKNFPFDIRPMATLGVAYHF